MTDVNAEVLDRLHTKDAMLFGLSDTMDVKASITLVVITFLATQSGVFLGNSGLIEGLRYVQLAAAFVLAGAGGFALATLWPRHHSTETAEQLDEWLEKLRAFYKDKPDADRSVNDRFRAGRIELLKERISTNAEIDRVKSQLLGWSFKLSAAALVLNMATLIGIALP